MTDKKRSIESPESSSPIVTRAVAAGLRGETAESYRLSGWQKAGLRLLGRLPQGAARFVIARFEALSGLDPSLLEDFNLDALIEGRLEDYHDLPGPFPAVTLGAALGGASAHLALALGGPFLPQAFVATLRGGASDGDVTAYYERSADLARRIGDKNRSLMTIQHFDPVHDGWMTGVVNHLRFKLIDLPWAYKDFIRTRLQRGGTVVYLDCGAKWLRYRVGLRSVFQIGGWGDLSAREFLDGSPRLEAYCRKARLHTGGWKLEDYKLEEGAESEWGSEAGLGEATEAFCRAEGYRFMRIALPQPHDYSRLAFQAALRRLQKAGRQPAGVLVEMFSQFDAATVQRAGLLPVWLVFNTLDSLEFLQRMRALFPPDRPVFFSPLATFSITPDLVPWEAWEAALQGLDWRNIGTRSGHYPADAWTLIDWARPLREWAQGQGKPVEAILTVRELMELVSHGVSHQD